MSYDSARNPCVCLKQVRFPSRAVYILHCSDYCLMASITAQIFHSTSTMRNIQFEVLDSGWPIHRIRVHVACQCGCCGFGIIVGQYASVAFNCWWACGPSWLNTLHNKHCLHHWSCVSQGQQQIAEVVKNITIWFKHAQFTSQLTALKMPQKKSHSLRDFTQWRRRLLN